MRITAAILARDERDDIEACVRSVAFCDEVLVLDSGSTDGTPALARAAGARVVETDWPGYVAQRNRAASLATHDWILSIDADERVDDALRRAVEALRARGEPAAAGYEVRVHTWCLGRWIDHGGWWPERHLRLFHRGRARWEGLHLHERLVADGAVERIDEGQLSHFAYRSISEHVLRMDRYTGLAARENRERGRGGGWGAMLLRPPWKFFRQYVLERGFLDGRAGFVLASLSAVYVFLKYAKTWELRRLEREAAVPPGPEQSGPGSAPRG